MIKRTLILTIIISLSFLFSCKNGEENYVLSASESLIEENSDSALILLKSIQDINSLTENERNKYYLLNTMARDKSYLDIFEDTIIFQVKRYYNRTNQPVYSALASFYSGRVYQEQGNNKKAIFEYLEAGRFIKQSDGYSSLKGLIESYIGDLYYEQALYEEAISHFKTAIGYFHKEGKFNNEAITFNQIGISFLIESPFQNKDSAAYYLVKGLEISNITGNKTLQSNLRHNIGLAWAEIDSLDNAMKSLQEANDYSPNDAVSAKIYFNVARIYFDYKMIDSAQIYINKSKAILLTSNNDYCLRKNLAGLESKILNTKGDYKKAMLLYEEFVDFLNEDYNRNLTINVLDANQKYNYEVQQNEHNKILIRNQRLTISLLVFALVMAILGVIYYVKSVRNKKALDEAEEKVISFKDTVEKYREKIEDYKNLEEGHDQDMRDFKTTLFQHFNIIKKAALLDGYLRKEDKENGQKVLRKFNEIIYGKDQLEWNVLYESMNKLNNGVLDLIKPNFPLLDETDFKICCLIFNDFSNTEISILLGLTTNSISSRRSSIRKKLGIEDYGNIAEYIKSALNMF